MTWNYRIIEHDQASSVYFAVHEVFYDESGRVEGWTSDPIDITGGDQKEVLTTLKAILKDVSHQSVLKESETEFKADGIKNP